MAVTRLYVQNKITLGRETTLPAAQAHYLRHVLRLAAGDCLTLFDGSGGEYTAEIIRLGRDGCRCLPVAFHAVERELSLRVHIIQAAVRSDKLDVVLQKATELGAADFQVVVSDRAALRLQGQKLARRLERWRKVVTEAAEQSGRTRLPPVCWRNCLQDVTVTGTGLALHPAAALAWGEVRDRLAAARDITLAIGPEGGWSSRDMERLCQHGLKPLRFGPRIMRTETAAPAMLAALQAILG